MSTQEFLLPDLGEGLTESEVVEWRVGPGDTVTLNQVIAEVETAKALVEIPSPYAGVVARLHAEEGQIVEVGEPLVTFELEVTEGANGTPAAHDGPAPATEEPAAASPEESAFASSGSADSSASSASAASPEESAAEESRPNLVGYGARAARRGRPTRRPRKPVAVPGVPPSDGVAPRATATRRATPGVRAMARRLGVDLTQVTGSGPDGRIVRDDVEAATHPEAGTHPDRSEPVETREPVRGVRKHTAAAMVASAAIPQATVHLTCDVTALTDLLARLREHPRAAGTRLTVLALVARAVCVLLPDHPALVTRWEESDDGPQLVRPAHVHLGIAVATDRGLVVPHVPHADELSLVGLARALGELAATARAGRTRPERLTGGTLTLTNVGVFGVDAGSPLLNPGESAILGIGRLARRPWEHAGEIALRQTVTLSLTFDHRVVDGEQGARFLADLGALLADPALALLLGGSDGADGADGADGDGTPAAGAGRGA
ncbi:pyruvate dehydrogenase E2 component (dihydrolipoamide acetyltransferase) [Isoptericola sp. CG 20/1183]|uniref:Dihydrolipoamide acetyltransferase component of pyruvate dehydrogenase complex n=1 Tax=Isoptericola halotolerans TaxID=300560 RepID=A0ABX5EL64_9MICO|nr:MULTISPECIES: dihydrolipoamide acetyltransferase family protein [Isoptericola]PRZ09612.1 pyruvate dehydrogenase E2 component (dihydrolipoamide acetyltransferase) [Isoptericola sp. CG 20/1183]PRZ10413.1 pyruvate dehydrogenase E2 component (dihydrolipoamide acetyltransferase) [Isoptericola halotolerans]